MKNEIREVGELDGKGWFAYRERMKGAPIDTVVLHSTAGSTLAGAISTLRERGLGYHYLIDKNGDVWKGAPALSLVGHAGESFGPNGPVVNRTSIGVSWVNLNDGKDPLTAEQIASAIELLKTLKEALPDLKWLTTHYAITVRPDGSSRKTDPRGADVLALATASGLRAWKPAWAKRYSL